MTLRFTDSFDMPKATKGNWKQRNGLLIPIKDMTNTHLSNSIRMVVRNYAHRHNGALTISSPSYAELYMEALKRGFHITLFKTPITLNGKTEWVEVTLPPPPSQLSKIAASFFPTELDSRTEE